MRHYGDITKLSGRELPFVDCIVGGSPCQDLSIAGARKGLDGERSSLFLEQTRIVKEMRDESLRTTGTARPRFLVWENVPGAFSSNGGKDFKTVLEEVVRIAEPQAPDVPMPKKWPKSGCLYDELGRWSIAWRVHDAQFWGVPQRRKRIALVADFDGMCAPEVLFERKGLQRNPTESGAQRERTTEGIKGSVGNAITFLERAGKPGGGKGILIQSERVGTLSTTNSQSVFAIQGNIIDRSENSGANGKGFCKDISYTLNATDKHAGCCLNDQGGGVMSVSDIPSTLRSQTHGHAPIVFQCAYDGAGKKSGDVSPTLCGNHMDRITDTTAICMDVGLFNIGLDRSSALLRRQYKDPPITYQKKTGSLFAYLVRRLTPLECERLQGFPDGWTDIGEWIDAEGKTHKESTDRSRYEALGNSIALPFWFYLMRRISAQYERPATLGSLFDGIGGFPLVWEKCNGQGTAIWASEIEEFCIAVTKKHFPEGTENK